MRIKKYILVHTKSSKKKYKKIREITFHNNFKKVQFDASFASKANKN